MKIDISIPERTEKTENLYSPTEPQTSDLTIHNFFILWFSSIAGKGAASYNFFALPFRIVKVEYLFSFNQLPELLISFCLCLKMHSLPIELQSIFKSINQFVYFAVALL